MRSKWLCLLTAGMLTACDTAFEVTGPGDAGPLHPMFELGAAGAVDVTIFGTAPGFEAAGEIAFTNTFEGITSGLLNKGERWDTAGVTYVAAVRDNVVAGPDSPFGYSSSVVCHSAFTPMQGEVHPGYDMLGFDLALIIFSELKPTAVDITITTTLDRYEFPDVEVQPAVWGPPFFGFVTKTAGEEITGFHLNTTAALALPCMDNVMVGVALRLIEAPIDIRPGSDTNPVHARSSGMLPVAVLSEGDFDASAVDVSTVALGGVPVAARRDGTPLASLEDVDRDGTDDLVLQFRIQDLVSAGALGAETASLALTGETASGEKFRGSDVVTVLQ